MRGSTALAGSSESPRAAEAGRPQGDLRDQLFERLAGRAFAFEITAAEGAVLAGSRRLADGAAALGVDAERVAADGERVEPGRVVCRGCGDAWQVARAEEHLMAFLGKASGVASAAAELVRIARGRARIVCGAWKKVPAELRADLRHAAAVGGVGTRILERPFVYLDKNHVRMLGGVVPAVRHARRIPGRAVVVQLRGETAAVTDEARQAASEGAEVLMVDTGRLGDLAAVARLAASGRLEGRAEVAFAGGVGRANLAAVIDAGAAVVDVGRAILDAPMVDFRLDVR
jgi:nicotinate-nucleotide pyrophosphorylase (carboxylating)